ncbi:signal-induced proliferation-associated protein 1, partial [Carlito syrichta]|uniref:Signal-induced proliferation-associated protein 1 n=1 Tax=Carlito syrichta TaxID=1868482 RepID=A0A1U7SYB9_CARSF
MVSEGAGSQPGWWRTRLGARVPVFSPGPSEQPPPPSGQRLLPPPRPAGWAPDTRACQCGPAPGESGPQSTPMWAGGVGCPRRGSAPAPTDDFFARKLRQPARPPLTPHTFEPRPARGPLLRSGSDAGEARPPTPASPRARAHSHEEASRPAAASPRIFTDPLALLGLPAEEPEPAFPPVLEPRWFAHYDVQSLLFDWAPRPRGTGGHAEASSGNWASAEDQATSSDLLLGAPGFVRELGGEGELGLGGPALPPVPPALPNAAVSILEEPQNRTSAYSLEHADLGAGYYRKYFYGKEHQNFFGLDEVLGPVAVSLRREEKEGSGGGTLHSYRVIVRTTQLRTLRGTISEDALPTGSPRGLSPKKLLEHVAPRLSPTCLRLGSASPKVPRTLLTLDEQVLSFQRKVGILYCRAGQGSEEEMYNNQDAGPAFTQFLKLLGDVVRLKGFESYRAQLDTKTDSTGTYSLYTTYQDHEIMFHVSTMLPYTPNNQQQLLRKRHIGNDIVTIVFQEPGSKPFSPTTIRSHFQHVFLVVRAQAPCTSHTSYRVAVSRTQDTPAFGPALPKGGGPFAANADFRAFLLAKALNGEQAAGHARQFHAMATRTRQQLRVCGQTLPSLGAQDAAQLLRSAPKVCVTVLPPDESGRPRRSGCPGLMSEVGSETLEDEWQSISEIASTCNTILESLSREGQPIPESGNPKGTPKSDAEPESGSLSEKVSHLESMLRKLQEDLQKEKADRAALEEEVRSLRHNNLRLQAESESAAARLLL